MNSNWPSLLIIKATRCALSESKSNSAYIEIYNTITDWAVYWLMAPHIGVLLTRGHDMQYHTHTQKTIQWFKLVCVHQLVVDGPQVSDIVCLVRLLYTGATSHVYVGSGANNVLGCLKTRIPWIQTANSRCVCSTKPLALYCTPSMVATSTLSNLRTSSKDEYGLPFKVFGVNRHGVIVLQHCMWDEGTQRQGQGNQDE